MARETDRETHEEIRLAWLHWSGGTDPLDTQTIAVLASPDGTLWARADVIEVYPALGAIDD